jgi:hypothetical protein
MTSFGSHAFERDLGRLELLNASSMHRHTLATLFAPSAALTQQSQTASGGRLASPTAQTPVVQQKDRLILGDDSGIVQCIQCKPPPARAQGTAQQQHTADSVFKLSAGRREVSALCTSLTHSYHVY